MTSGGKGPIIRELYPGVAQLVARMVRDHLTPPHPPPQNIIPQSLEPQRFKAFFVPRFGDSEGLFFGAARTSTRTISFFPSLAGVAG